MARALLFQANLPIRFWGESILAATYLINRTPNKLLDYKTPYELLYNKPPSYDNIRVFGTLCFARRISRHRDKFHERSTRCLFLGYPMGQKGWLVFDLETEKTSVSRDVMFHEEKFPYITPEPSTPAAAITAPHPAVFEEEHTEESIIATPIESPSGGVITPHSPSDQSQETSLDSPEQQPINSSTEELGRGRRQKTQSVLLKPYVTYTAQAKEPHNARTNTKSESSNKVSYPLTDFVSFHRLSPQLQAYLAKVATESEPLSFEEAMCDPRWNNAVIVEADALELNHTWDVTDLPPGKVAIG